jgi:hypothetical protein
VALSFLYRLVRRVVELLRILRMDDAAKDAEILVLRHQTAVLQRPVARPDLTWSDRAVIAMLAKLIPRERWAAYLVTPETILRWHRALVRRRWTYPHRRPGRPALPQQTVELIVRLARANPRWGYLRIVGELKKLGVTVSKGSVANILRSNDLRPARRAGPIWAEFLRAQAKGIVATDFFTSTGCSSERHLERVLEELVEHYNAARPHRGIDLEVPIPYVSGRGLDGSTRIQRVDRLGGLLHEYSIAA